MTNTPKPAEKIILALDGMDKREALELINKLPDLIWVKVGLELFVNGGPELLAEIHQQGKRIFLDLKFHDIPATMAGACYQAAKTGVELITVHACAGNAALNQASLAILRGASEIGYPPPILLAVTVLTSWSEESFVKELRIDQPLNKRVQWLAELAANAGIGGCICSPLEVQLLRTLFPSPFELITPGIRTNLDSSEDQARGMSPSEAINAGASKIVIGRPITKAHNPIYSFSKYCDELI